MNRFKNKNVQKEAQEVSRGDHIQSQRNSTGHWLSALAALSILGSFKIATLNRPIQQLNQNLRVATFLKAGNFDQQ